LLAWFVFVSSARVRFIFCERAKVNVRAKSAGVNSVFLVQLRKILPAVVTNEHQ
jgi:hypothetical protein